MQAEIHPEYHPATVTCACGTVWETRSTRKQARVGICSKCHPFYTGNSRSADLEGRIDAFNRRYAKAAPAAAATAAKKK
jgi:large subunit ribosomal protein L31